MRRRDWLAYVITVVGGLGFALGVALFTFFLVSATGCALFRPTIYAEQPLVDQRLHFRPDRPGKLTYLVCLAKDPAGTCTQEVIREVDLAIPAKRDQLNELGFICQVGAERYKVCATAPGLCQITRLHECSGFLHLFCTDREIVAKYLDSVENHDELLQSNAACFQKDRYPFDPGG